MHSEPERTPTLRELARRIAHEKLGGNPDYDAAVRARRARVLDAISPAFTQASTLAGEVIEDATTGRRFVLKVSHDNDTIRFDAHEIEQFKPGRWRERKQAQQPFIALRYEPNTSRWRTEFTALGKQATPPAVEHGIVDDAMRVIAEYVAMKLRPDHEWAREA